MEDGKPHVHELVRTLEDDAVCSLCGLVVDSGVCDYAAPAPKGQPRAKASYHLAAAKRLYGTYAAIFHFNERLAQLCLAEPAIPQELWCLIEVEFDFGDFERTYPDAKALTKQDISKICGIIRVPDKLQEKYRSKKFKQQPLSNMKRFAEKWLTIRKRLGGEAPPPLHPNDINAMQRDFLALLRPFNIFRHNPGCSGGNKCHKGPTKCRHNLPNYNYIIFQLLRRRGKAEVYRKFLPQLRTTTKIKNLDSLCKQIWDWLGWNFVPVFQRKQSTSAKLSPRKKIVKRRRRTQLPSNQTSPRRSPRLATKYSK
jgi:hypothetical protein